MTRRPFPTVAAYPLPAPLMHLPDAAPERLPANETIQAKGSDERDDMVQAVSEVIARRARQRRYTP